MESLADKRDRWRAEAVDVVGAERVDGMLNAAQQRAVDERGHRLIDTGSGTFVGVDVAATTVLDRVAQDRATWRRWHVYAETQRQLRGVPGLSVSARQDLAQQVTDRALAVHPGRTPESTCDPRKSIEKLQAHRARALPAVCKG